MGKPTSRKWFRNKNKIHRMRGEGYCVSTKNTDGEFEESAPASDGIEMPVEMLCSNKIM